MTRIRLCFLFVRLVGTAIVTFYSGADGRENSLARHLELSNESGERLQIEWIHPITGEAVPYGISEPAPRQHFELDSFVNHTFIIRTVMGNSKNRTSNEASVKSTVLTVGEQEEQVFVVKKDLVVDIKSTEPRVLSQREVNKAPPSEASLPSDDATYIVQKCRQKFVPEHGTKSSWSDKMEQLVECFTNEAASALMIKNEYLSFQRNLRQKISYQTENYTCADPTLKTSKPIEVRTWTNEGVIREVGVLHRRPSSQIHIITDFISQSECDAIKQAAEPTLHRGVVADGKGGSQLSDNRKAWQAGVSPSSWDDTDPIASVKRRLFAYANFVTGYNMSLDGQEEIMSIQYFGSGYNDTKPDQYTPHCDGDCDSMPHKSGGRVATMVMYCDVPIAGGATNFQHANVYVKPTKYAGVFFSYMNPKTRVQEEGFTTHSGCPVYEGTKRIAVQWMRVGVDDENPWDSFDTNTVSLKLRQQEDDI